MHNRLGKKAELKFSPLEIEYQKRYGMMPDYHYEDLRRQHGSETASKTVQANMDRIWAEQKESTNPAFCPAETNPFEKV